MKKIEVLAWGMEHIASNHNFNANVDYEEDGSMCIFGGCNVPTLSDVEMLCEDLGIDRDHIKSSDFGIDVWLEWEWTHEREADYEEEYEWGKLLADYVPTGHEMWKRHDVQIAA